MKQLLRCFGLLVLLSVAGVGLAQDTEFSPPTPVCEPTFEDGIFPGDGSFIFNQTVNGDSGMPYYEGPFAIRNSCKYGVGYYGFDYLGWYDNDFGWRHTFFPPLGQREVEGIPCPSAAKLYICAWDVDQSDCVPAHPNQPDFCERDLVFGDGVALTPDRLDGSNYNWNVTEFTVPLELLADGGEGVGEFSRRLEAVGPVFRKHLLDDARQDGRHLGPPLVDGHGRHIEVLAHDLRVGLAAEWRFAAEHVVECGAE